MKDVFVSGTARSYINRIIAEANNRTDRLMFTPSAGAAEELENLAKMKAFSLGNSFVSPEDIKEMARYVIGRRHGGTRADNILEAVPYIVPRVSHRQPAAPVTFAKGRWLLPAWLARMTGCESI